MPNRTKNVTPDRSKIHTQDATELKYWSRALCASESDVLAAVEKVGNSVAARIRQMAGLSWSYPDASDRLQDPQGVEGRDRLHLVRFHWSSDPFEEGMPHLAFG